MRHALLPETASAGRLDTLVAGVVGLGIFVALVGVGLAVLAGLDISAEDDFALLVVTLVALVTAGAAYGVITDVFRRRNLNRLP